ncbi:MAG: hypothetical protein K8S23_08900 [Candidatus Cloacimonetes bacterium]|nr:hypothetical protein [Candidatus Cloacimonadota bacterium]
MKLLNLQIFQFSYHKMKRERKKILLFIFAIFILCTVSAENIFDSYKGKVYCNSKKSIQLELIEKIDSYQSESGTEEFSPKIVTLSSKNNQIIFFNRFDHKIIVFNLDTFTNESKPLKIIQKTKGKGPNELIYPIDLFYDDNRDRLYIADLKNFCIYIYDNEFNEIKRIKLDFRPYRLFLSLNYLNITLYDSTIDFCTQRIDLNYDKLIDGLFEPSKKGSLLEKKYRNMLFTINTNEKESKFFVTRNYPDFTIYSIKSGNIEKAFCNTALLKKKLPKPKYKIIENDKKTWGIMAFSDLAYSPSKKLLFTLTTHGWAELAEKKGLNRYICIFDENGNTLCEYKILPYNGAEDSLIFDEKNLIIYYATYDSIWKLKIKKE